MAAIMATWRSFHSYNKRVIRCKANFQLTGRRPKAKGDLEIEVSDNEYANDTTFTFESREDCERLTPLIVTHFSRWGLEVHVGYEENDSKSEILFCAKDPRCYANSIDYDGIDLPPIRWDGGFHIAVTDKFKYLGSYLTRNGKDGYDDNSRISSADNAFDALRNCMFSLCNISTIAKRSMYL
jgi:hypothetical protein